MTARSCRCGLRNPGGFTLIEMLAVVMIVSIVASITMINMAGMSEHAALQTARTELLDLDRRARLLGRTGQVTIMEFTSNTQVALLSILEPEEQIALCSFPAGLTVQCELNGRPSTQVMYDRLGHSADFLVVIQRTEKIESRMSVSGLTGYSTIEANR